MPISTRYVFIASMDVNPEKEDLFNEVYDTEHVPYLLECLTVHPSQERREPGNADCRQYRARMARWAGAFCCRPVHRPGRAGVLCAGNRPAARRRTGGQIGESRAVPHDFGGHAM